MSEKCSEYCTNTDFCDAYFSDGCYEDGTRLTEDELNKLTDLAGDVLWEMAFESLT